MFLFFIFPSFVFLRPSFVSPSNSKCVTRIRGVARPACSSLSSPLRAAAHHAPVFIAGKTSDISSFAAACAESYSSLIIPVTLTYGSTTNQVPAGEDEHLSTLSHTYKAWPCELGPRSLFSGPWDIGRRRCGRAAPAEYELHPHQPAGSRREPRLYEHQGDACIKETWARRRKLF